VWMHQTSSEQLSLLTTSSASLLRTPETKAGLSTRLMRLQLVVPNFLDPNSPMRAPTDGGRLGAVVGLMGSEDPADSA